MSSSAWNTTSVPTPRRSLTARPVVSFAQTTVAATAAGYAELVESRQQLSGDARLGDRRDRWPRRRLVSGTCWSHPSSSWSWTGRSGPRDADGAKSDPLDAIRAARRGDGARGLLWGEDVLDDLDLNERHGCLLFASLRGSKCHVDHVPRQVVPASNRTGHPQRRARWPVRAKARPRTSDMSCRTSSTTSSEASTARRGAASQGPQLVGTGGAQATV